MMHFIPVLDYLAIKIPESIPALFAGEEKNLNCSVEGLSPLTVRWLMNNTVLKERKSQQGNRVNLSLYFPELDLHHTGNYTCEASNYNRPTKKRTTLVTVTCKQLLLKLFLDRERSSFFPQNHAPRPKRYNYAN